jgi:hypothetical protein
MFGVVLAVLATALAFVIVLPAGPGNHRRSHPIVTHPIRIDGSRTTKVLVDLNVRWTRVEPALHDDVARASGITGLYGCAPNPPDASSMPEAPGFFCSATSAFGAASLVTVEHLSNVAGIGGRAGRHFDSLFFLGVLRGQPALVVQPIGSSQRIQSDLVVLRGLPGVLECGSADVGPMLADTIACATRSHAVAIRAQKDAYHLNVAYAEVMASW